MIEKLYLLLLLLRFHSLEVYKMWKKEVWKKNMDDHYCCDARDFYGLNDCGCNGVTVREWFGYVTAPEDKT